MQNFLPDIETDFFFLQKYRCFLGCFSDCFFCFVFVLSFFPFVSIKRRVTIISLLVFRLFFFVCIFSFFSSFFLFILRKRKSCNNQSSLLLVSVPVFDIHVRSEGCEDAGRADPCGKAYIKVDGTDHSPHSRGYNVVVVDGATGTTNYAA